MFMGLPQPLYFLKNVPEVPAVVDQITELTAPINPSASRLHEISRWSLDNISKSETTVENSMLFYPLSIPNLDQVIIDLLNGKETAVQPINNAYFHMRFFNTSANPCAGNDTELLILVKSAVANQDKRRVVRSLWANSTHLSTLDVNIGYAFLLGKSQNESENGQVITEMDTYGDIILMDYTDTYKNLTYKTVGSLRWPAEHCRSAAFTVYVDDDMYLGVERLIQFLQYPRTYPNAGGSDTDEDNNGRSMKWKWGFGPNDHVYGGQAFSAPERLVPIRITESKWYMSWEEYPLAKLPIYIHGPTVILARRTLNEILVGSLFVKALVVDDVYVGVIASKLRIPVLHIPYVDVYVNDDDGRRWNCSDPSSLQEDIFAFHIWVEEKRRDFVNKCEL